MTEVITDSLDLWSSALLGRSNAGRGGNGTKEAHGINKLRELVLELAVRGKLLPQEPSDEPAGVLLKRIARSKARLVGEREGRKEALLPPITEEEKRFILPNGWEWIRFGNIFDLEYGSNLPEAKRTNSGEYAVYGSNGIVGSHDSYCVDGPCIVVGRKGSAGALNLCLDDKCWVTDVAYSVIPPTGLDLEFVFKLFHTLGLDSLGKGIKPGLNRNEAYVLAVAIPSLNEQRRIVAKVDELMALCDHLEQQQTDGIQAHETLVENLLGTLARAASPQELAEAWNRIANSFDIVFTTEYSIDQLKQTILQLAVMGKLVAQDPNDEPANVLLDKIATEKSRLIKDGLLRKEKPLPPLTDEERAFPLPQGWVWVKFGLIAEFINGDRSKNYPNRSEYVDNGVPWINTGHIEPDGRLTTVDMNFISREKFDSLNGGKIQKGDLVYCLRGATFGKTAFVEPYEEGAIASSLMIVRPFITSLNRYIFNYLIGPFGRKQLFRFDNGSAQPNLSAGNVMLYACPLPPLAEQHRIVTKLDELMALCGALKKRLAEAQATQNQLADAIVEQAVA